MTETVESPETSPATDAAPRKVIGNAPLSNLIATLCQYCKVPIGALNMTLEQKRESGECDDPVAEVDHFEFIESWCTENPHYAARIVMAAVYLSNGRFIVQEEAPAAQDAPPAAPADEE